MMGSEMGANTLQTRSLKKLREADLKTPPSGDESESAILLGPKNGDFSLGKSKDWNADAMWYPTECEFGDMEFIPDHAADVAPSAVKSEPGEMTMKSEPSPSEPSPPRRPGLRARTRRVVTKFDESSGEEDFKVGKSVALTREKAAKRKRHPPTKPEECDELLEGSTRQERPVPTGLDEKQTRRVLRNRASAERSRLRRLVRITELEEDNKRLRMQIAQKQPAPRPNPRDAALHESNAQLKAELQLMRNRVATLTGLLQTATRTQ